MSTPLDGLANTIEQELAKTAPAPLPILTTGIVDVHGPDGACDIDAFKAGGGVAFIHKATEGRDFVDKAVARVVPTLKPAGLLAGVYHFANATDPEVQAEHFLRTVEPFGEAALHILDRETNDSSFGTMSLAQSAVWVKYVRHRTGRWPVFYTYEHILHRDMNAADAETRATLGHCPLWIAKYGPPPKAMPAAWGAWNDWSLWQYSSSTDNGPADQVRYPRGVPGFKRRSQDRNVFRGSVEDLTLWWKLCGRVLAR